MPVRAKAAPMSMAFGREDPDDNLYGVGQRFSPSHSVVLHVPRFEVFMRRQGQHLRVVACGWHCIGLSFSFRVVQTRGHRFLAELESPAD